MTTVILGDLPEVDALLERRRSLGHDHRDEIWEGVYYVVPHANSSHGDVAAELMFVLREAGSPLGLRAIGEVNIGEPGDFRVPDAVARPSDLSGLYLPTATIVVEVLSPHDQSMKKFGFYARRGVQEVWIADADERTVRIWELTGEEYTETGRSGVLSLTKDDVEGRIRWP